MLYSLLAVADKTRPVGIGEAALYALLGYLIVFLGIAFLILVVWAVGKIVGTLETKEKENKQKQAVETVINEEVSEDEVSEETVAVITAALMAYYQQNNPKCEFTVKRIKRV